MAKKESDWMEYPAIKPTSVGFYKTIACGYISNCEECFQYWNGEYWCTAVQCRNFKDMPAKGLLRKIRTNMNVTHWKGILE